MQFQKKILIIEDDQRLGVTIQNVLTFHKYDVCYANNGMAGIQKAFEYNPDLILCDINMDPLDGYQVYKVLEESSILNKIPFVFLTGSSDLEDIRYGMSLGADDYIVKPFNNADLIKTIERRLEKFKAIREDSNREFIRLFDLSPIGILIFDGKKIYQANSSFKKLLNVDKEDLTGIGIDQFIDSVSIQKLQGTIPKYVADRNEIFNGIVKLNRTKGDEIQMKFVVSEFEKFSNYTLFIGLFYPVLETPSTIDSNLLIAEVNSLLKHENIKVTDTLGEKITNIFKQKQLNLKNHKNTLFTTRENQVLCLSMEGLPIKNIADRLSISDRTVEKYRTRLMEKARAGNMIEVIVFALKNGLVEI
jgi:DNA-binding NarL/FixJ family response regulator